MTFNHSPPPVERVPNTAVAMPTNKPGTTEPSQEGLSFANVLHECLSCGIIVVNGNKQLASLTNQAKQLLNLHVGSALSPSFDALPMALQTIVSDALAMGRSISGRQLELPLNGGQTRPICASALPLNPGKSDSSVLLILNDLTSAKALEQHLQWLERLASIGTLSASMAHEIKNALVAGKTFIDLLLEKHQDAELVEIVRREMGRIDSIVSQMLRFAGPAKPTFSTIRLHEILDHSLRLVQPQLEGKSISLSRSFQAASDLVNGDDYQLQQAFVNLFLNALEAMGPNGTLTVATDIVSPNTALSQPHQAAERKQVQVTITDTGAGIPPENMGRLFEPFFTTKINGTGLGLPITRRIIREHRGSIDVQSILNHGTTFTIVWR